MKITDLIKNIKPEPVAIKVPAWGNAEVYIIPPSRDQLDAHDEIITGEGESVEVSAIYHLVQQCLVEEDGVQAYDTADDFIEATRRVPFDGIGEIYHCLLSRQVREIAKVKAAEKNSKTQTPK